MTRRTLIKSLAKVNAPSYQGMTIEDRANGIKQMLSDLVRLAKADGCIAAAWALETIEAIVQQNKDLKHGIRTVIEYPPKGNPRRTKRGYPSEIVYEQRTYERMVDSYRDGLKKIIED